MFGLQFKDLYIVTWCTADMDKVLNNWGVENNVCAVLLLPVYGSVFYKMDISDPESWKKKKKEVKAELFLFSPFLS